MGAKSTSEDTLEEAFQLVLDVPEDAHPRGVMPRSGTLTPGPEGQDGAGGPGRQHERNGGHGRGRQERAGDQGCAEAGDPPQAPLADVRDRDGGARRGRPPRASAPDGPAGSATSASATATASVLPAIPRPFGGAAPVNGSAACRSPATTAASSTAVSDLQRAPDRVANRLRGERQQAEREQRRQQRAEREEEPLPRRPPGERQPRARRARRRRARAPTRRSRAAAPGPRARRPARAAARTQHQRAGDQREQRREERRVERRPRRPSSRRTAPRPRARASRSGTESSGTVVRVLRRRSRSAKVSRSSWARCAAGGLAAGSSASIRSTSAQSGFGRSGRACASGAAPVSIRFARLEQRAVPERMPAGERLPEHRPDRPDVGGRPAGLAVHEPLGRHVGERPGHVAGRGQRLLLGQLREAEVEQPRRDALAFGEQDVRRLHVAVDDPARVRVRETLEHLGGRLDRGASFSSPARSACAHRLPGHVLVGDVDVARVPVEPVGAQAALVPQPCRRQRLALGPRRRFALARDDLERDLEAGALVTCEPDRARAAAAERAQGPIPLRQRARWWKGQAPPRPRDLGFSPVRSESCAGRATR